MTCWDGIHGSLLIDGTAGAWSLTRWLFSPSSNPAVLNNHQPSDSSASRDADEKKKKIVSPDSPRRHVEIRWSIKVMRTRWWSLIDSPCCVSRRKLARNSGRAKSGQEIVGTSDIYFFFSRSPMATWDKPEVFATSFLDPSQRPFHYALPFDVSPSRTII